MCGILLALLASSGAAAANRDLHATLMAFLQEQTADINGQAAIEISMRDVPLGPCHAPRPFLPRRGTRLGGYVTIGVKCPGDQPLTRYFRAYIGIETTYFVAAHTLKSGERIAPADLKRVSGDVTRLSPGVVTDPTKLLGMITARRVAQGVPLTKNMVQREMAIKRGDRVKVIAKGTGFTITTSGEALNSAPIGGQISVRTQGGATVTGSIRGENTVIIMP